MPTYSYPRTLVVSERQPDRDAGALVITHTEPLTERDLVAIAESLYVNVLAEYDRLIAAVLAEADISASYGHRTVRWHQRLGPRALARRLGRRIHDRVHRHCA